MKEQCWKIFPRSIHRSAKFDTRNLKKIRGAKYVYEAPDGSSIRKFQDVRYGGVCHCILPPGAVASAHAHKTVDEIWYCVSGTGEIWRKQGRQSKTVRITKDDCITIPMRTHFQFRNIGRSNLTLIIVTMPPWPGPDEAYEVKGHWKL